MASTSLGRTRGRRPFCFGDMYGLDPRGVEGRTSVRKTETRAELSYMHP